VAGGACLAACDLETDSNITFDGVMSVVGCWKRDDIGRRTIVEELAMQLADLEFVNDQEADISDLQICGVGHAVRYVPEDVAQAQDISLGKHVR
jgi:hypothetical protein